MKAVFKTKTSLKIPPSTHYKITDNKEYYLPLFSSELKILSYFQ